MTQLQGVTCHLHMGSHSVTCYPTQVNTPRHVMWWTHSWSLYCKCTDQCASKRSL